MMDLIFEENGRYLCKSGVIDIIREFGGYEIRKNAHNFWPSLYELARKCAFGVAVLFKTFRGVSGGRA